MNFPKIPSGYPGFFAQLRDLYQEMRQQMAVNEQQEMPLLDRYQGAFDLSVNYRLRVDEFIQRGAAFQDEEQEIFFYRQIKPLFLAETLFYTFCYHIQLFSNDNDCPAEILVFLKRQLHRMPRFEARYADVLAGIRADDARTNRMLFTRAGRGKRGTRGVNRDTLGENVLAECFANLRFRRFLQELIGLLETRENGVA